MNGILTLSLLAAESGYPMPHPQCGPGRLQLAWKTDSPGALSLNDSGRAVIAISCGGGDQRGL